MKTSNDVVYPVRFKRALFEQVKAAAAKEDLQAVQFIRRAVVREIKAHERRAAKFFSEESIRA